MATFGRRRTAKFGIIHAGGEREIAVGEAGSARQQDVALAKVDAGGADVTSRDRCLRDGDAAALDDGIFLDDDGVGGIRDHAAGENPHRFARANRLFERAAGRDLADHLEPRRDVGGIGRSHRIAVHRRHRLRRLGAQRRDVARQHAMMRRVERDHFLGQRVGALQDRGQRVGNRH